MSALPSILAPLERTAADGAAASSAQAAAGAPRRRWLRWGLVGMLALASLAIALRSSRQAALPDGLLVVNGRLEGDTVRVAGKEAGRIARLLAREGDTVNAGQELAYLDDAALRTREAQARAALNIAERRVQAARVSLDVARRQVPLDVQTARAVLDASGAALAKATVAELQAQRDDERAQLLLSRGVLERQLAEQATLARELAHAELGSARAARERAQRELARARLGDDQLRVRAAEIDVLEAAAAQAAAQLAEVQTALDELVIRSPIAGTITQRFANLGEVVGPSAPLYELVDLDALYLRAYVPAPMMGLIPLGAPARIHTDATPDQPAPATLRYVSPRAEFTPKDVQTPDERVKLVYAVKLYLTANPEHRLSPGLSADAVIRYREGVPWAPPRW